TGRVDSGGVQAALDRVNTELPHYRQVRNFTILREAFTPENGLLTANGKLKRDVINRRFQHDIDHMYSKHAVAAGSNS
ncbi:MAG TPA: hypothetical protein VFI45_17910, partial [Candidatus Acidoferrum sp.]|nr:hypothetical protein [Candidatus Acidoferrum sp.]